MDGGIVISEEDPMLVFDVLALLGQGSYGSVYKALDKRDGSIVAIKIMDVDNDAVTELQKEINILRQCQSPYIVQYKGTFQKDNSIWV